MARHPVLSDHALEIVARRFAVLGEPMRLRILLSQARAQANSTARMASPRGMNTNAGPGVTIMMMDPGVDTGGAISQRAIPIEVEDTGGTLVEKLSLLGEELLTETLPRYLSGELQPQAQDDSKATYAPMLKKEDGRLDFTRPVDELARLVRAFNPRPGAFFEWNGEMLKVHLAHAEMGKAEVGQRLVYEGQPAVGSGNGHLVLDEVQPAGKKSMSGKAFLSGARGWTS